MLAMTAMQKWHGWAKALKREALVMYFAMRDPRTPWYAKGLAACVVAYAFSPIDLIPDPIPVLGYLDDLVIVPLGVWLVRRLIPPAVLTACREKVESGESVSRRVGLVGATVIVALWVAMIIWLTAIAIEWWRRSRSR